MQNIKVAAQQTHYYSLHTDFQFKLEQRSNWLIFG